MTLFGVEILLLGKIMKYALITLAAIFFFGYAITGLKQFKLDVEEKVVIPKEWKKEDEKWKNQINRLRGR